MIFITAPPALGWRFDKIDLSEQQRGAPGGGLRHRQPNHTVVRGDPPCVPVIGFLYEADLFMQIFLIVDGNLWQQ